METFYKLFGSLLACVYHGFDRIVIQGYLPLLTRPEHIVHFFRDVHGLYPITPQVLAKRTLEYRGWVEGYRLKNLEEARANEEIALKIHELRAAAALTQTQLAKLIGTTASVICRLEDADYEGHSLAMFRRIAGALNQRVEIRFVPIRRSA